MRRARIIVGAAAVAFTASLLVASCGKKGPPRPPPRLIPAPIADLRVRQTADRLVLEMSYPAVTTSGLALPAVEAVEILTLRPRPGGGAAPRVDPQMFAVTAQVTKRLEGADLLAATRGAELVIELDAAPGAPMGPLSEAELAAAAAASAASAEAAATAALAAAATEAAQTPAATPAPATATPTPAAGSQADAGAPAGGAGATATPTAATPPTGPTATPLPAGPPPILIAVRSFGPRKNESPLSNIVAIVPRVAPVAPATVVLEPVTEGIRVVWTVTGEVPASGYDVLRRKLGESTFGARVAQVGADRLDHVDATAVYGAHYQYTVRSVAARDPLVESADGPIGDLEYKDAFAPPTPSGLVALAEEGRVRLVWDRVDASDLAGYRLYRQESGGAETELPRDPGAGTDHIDDGVRAGVAYNYRVTAVDREDNESAKSEPAMATPR